MPKPTPGKQYTVVDENSLSQISRRAYGNVNHWRRIWRANQSALRSDNPDLIYPGEIIYIPEIAELLPDEPNISNREPDELSIVLDGIEIRSTAARVMLTMDTPSDGWTATLNWLPGDNPLLDARVLPYAYTPAKVYIGGVLIISGYLYNVGSSVGNRGTVKNLAGFSKTADLIDSNLRPPYEENNVTLEQRAQKLVEPHGLKAIFETDTGGAFDRVTASESDKIFGHLNKLSFQRAVLFSSTPDGNPLFWSANIDGAPVATLEEGQPPVRDFAASFDGRRRFGTYRAVVSSPFGNSESPGVKDPGVPRSRFKTIRVQDSLAGEVEAAAKWERNRTLADALTIPIPVSGWLNPRTGTPWQVNTKVTVKSPAIHVPDGFDFLIRSIEFNEKEDEKTATLNIIPPQVYSKEEIVEPWE
jgi:prophage tail gpP-like protein